MQSVLLRLDTFRKIPLELTNPTVHGAYLSIAAYVVMALLFLMELYAYFSPEFVKSVDLDLHYSEHIWIDFDVIMHQLHCDYTKVVVRDIVGGEEIEVLDKKITKEKLDTGGNFKAIAHPTNDNDNNNNHHNHDHPELDADWDSTSDHFKHTDFEAVLDYHDFTMVNFYADWCIHCRRFAPIWKEAEDKTDKMTLYDKNRNSVITKLLRVNCVDFGQLCARLGIRAYPTVRLYKKDRTFTQYGGERAVDNIIQFVKDFVHNEDTHQVVAHHSAYEEGCRVHGQVKVRRVPGFFLLEADSTIDSLEPSMTNVSHTVNSLWFYDNENDLLYVRKQASSFTKDILQNTQPLKSQTFVAYKQHTAPQHYLNVIPTILNDKAIVYQTTVQSHVQDVNVQAVPEARFSYNFSPMVVKINKKSRPFYDFLTSLFAIVGGTYTFISLLDKFFDTVSERYKSNVGKLG